MATRRSLITPQFGFNDATGQYYWLNGPNKGRFVPRTEVRRVIDEYLENKSKQVRTLAEQLRNREISIAQWQRAMEQNIARVHLANAAAAKGGWHALGQSDYGRIGSLVKQEYKYLREFAVQIENGLPLDGRFTARVEQYSQAGRHTFYVFKDLEAERLGLDEERSVRHAQDSCEDCLYWAAKGWVPRGSSPHPGARRCRRKCKCDKIFRKRGEGDQDPISTKHFGGSVDVKLDNESKIHEFSRKHFGRELAQREWADLVGAPNGSRVRVKHTGQSIVISTEHDDLLEGTMFRSLEVDADGLFLNNIGFEKKPTAFQGMGVRVFATQVRAARELGIRRIKTLAQGYPGDPEFNGYYTWPRLGFNARLTADQKRRLPDSLKGAQDLHDLMLAEDGPKWWKENGIETRVEFDTDPSSLHSKILNAYLDENEVVVK
jgi:hypothetical protein